MTIGSFEVIVYLIFWFSRYIYGGCMWGFAYIFFWGHWTRTLVSCLSRINWAVAELKTVTKFVSALLYRWYCPIYTQSDREVISCNYLAIVQKIRSKFNFEISRFIYIYIHTWDSVSIYYSRETKSNHSISVADRSRWRWHLTDSSQSKRRDEHWHCCCLGPAKYGWSSSHVRHAMWSNTHVYPREHVMC